MKKLVLAFMAVLVSVVAAVAQTPKEIVDRMEATMNAHEKEGVIMTVDLKLLIVGTTTSKSYMLGDKTRVEMKMMGVQIITWSDGEKDWTYISKDNTLTIRLKSCSDPSIILGYPGPSKKFSQHVVTKINDD